MRSIVVVVAVMVAGVSPVCAQSSLGGGFIEFLFARPAPQGTGIGQVAVAAPPEYDRRGPGIYVSTAPMEPQPGVQDAMPVISDPRFLPQEVDYFGHEAPGTIVIDTPQKFLFLVEPGGKAMRYGIGVGRPGFTWAGTHSVSSKKEWPDWRPPEEMLKRQPYLPPFMAGGPNNPLGARAMYLGSTLYRIHGSNEPWTIGLNVSSGCIRMRNEDIVDLYERVKVGTKVVVL